MTHHQNKPFIILRQLSNDAITQCHFIFPPSVSLASARVGNNKSRAAATADGNVDNDTNLHHNRHCSTVLAASGNQLCIFNLKTRRICLRVFTKHQSTILSCGIFDSEAFLRRGSDTSDIHRYLVSWGRDGYIELNQINWSQMKHVECIQRLKIGKEASFCKWVMEEKVNGVDSPVVIYIPEEDESTIARIHFSTEKNQLQVVDRFLLHRKQADESSDDDEEEDHSIINTKKHRGMLMSLAVNSKYVCVAWESGLISVLDKTNPEGGILFEFKTQEKDPKQHPEPITEIFTFKDQYLAVGSSSSIVNVFDLQTQKLVKQYELPHKAGINHFSGDENRFLVAAGWDHRVRIYDMKRHKSLGALRFHTGTVNCVSVLQPNGVLNLEGESAAMEAKVTSEDGKEQTGNKSVIICSGGDDRRIAIWKISFEKKK